ncbi:hypothetical protein OKW38_003625 [Paraburkholderia sp. MM5496-R1]|uniref:HEAT repeat domain-containing protein n=1 Tax=Paraburkholderia sp. MM5496-R1 TaxID=2991065 RepID=UPI003D22887A
MGFKADTSFLRFLTMGALGTLHVVHELHARGFAPIELERYSTSNKIWSTKIKRLRLPDLLCVKTGLRIEVRAKASLNIRMSHAPNNPERHWDAGLRDEDVIALIACKDVDGISIPAGASSFFGVRDLRDSVDAKQLSGMKAASEGSEQYLTWPSIVSNRPGTVLDYDDERLFVGWGGDGAPARRYCYALKGKRSYLLKGQTFASGTEFLAGTPATFADMRPYLRQAYRPLDNLQSANIVDRYSATKAIPFRPDTHADALPVLADMLGEEEDKRLALEVAGSAAALGLTAGVEYLRHAIWNETEAPMRMEAAFITTELGTRTGAPFSREILSSVAADRSRFDGDEVRQAAVWGLGRAGLRAYRELLPYLADDDDNVALHAIAAFGPDADQDVVGQLVNCLQDISPRRVAAASEALRNIGSRTVLHAVIEAARVASPNRPWVLATLGRLPAEMVRGALAGDRLHDEVAPLLMISSGSWLSAEDAVVSLRFLMKQAV